MKLQTLVLDKLTDIIEDFEYTVVVEHSAGNVGYVIALDDKLDNVAAIHFDFQTKYFSLRFFEDMTLAKHSDWISTGSGRTTNSQLISKAADYLRGRLT